MADSTDFDALFGEKPKGIEFPDFRCRVCGHDKYFPIHEVVGPVVLGRNTWKVSGYECCKCSSRFADPRKFSWPVEGQHDSGDESVVDILVDGEFDPKEHDQIAQEIKASPSGNLRERLGRAKPKLGKTEIED